MLPAPQKQELAAGRPEAWLVRVGGWGFRLCVLRSGAHHTREGELQIVPAQRLLDFTAGIEDDFERADVGGSDALFLHRLAVRLIHRLGHLSAAGDVVAHFLAVDARTERWTEDAEVAQGDGVSVFEMFDDFSLEGFQASRDVHFRQRTAIHDAGGDFGKFHLAGGCDGGEPSVRVFRTGEMLFYFCKLNHNFFCFSVNE